MRVNRIAALLFPPRCASCRKLDKWNGEAQKRRALCTSCARNFEAASRAECEQCFLPMYECRCVPPLMKKAGITEHIKAVPYGDGRFFAPRRFILFCKSHCRKEDAAFAAEQLAAGVRSALERAESRANGMAIPTVLAYLPRARRAVCRYGFDQAQVLASALGKELGIPVVPLLKRRKGGKKQKTLTAGERYLNMREAFRAKDASGLRVLLVDDVVTTGSSMAAAGEALRRAGAVQVIGVSLAYTPKNMEKFC